MCQYLTADDWAAFAARYPDADAFLRQRSLIGERMALEKHSALQRTPFQIQRLEELRLCLDWQPGMMYQEMRKEHAPHAKP